MDNFDTATPVSCIIFDCDGTLIDSEMLSHQAMVQVFAELGVTLDIQECIDHFEGGKLADILQETCERYQVNVSIDELEPRYRNACHTLFESHLQPIPGVPQLLRYLKSQQIDMCVASNGPISKMMHTLQLTGLLQFFQGKLFSAFDTNSWKPAPDLIHYAALNMAYPVEHCLFIDDTNRGIQAGINAGMRTIHFNPNPASPTTSHPLVKRVHSMGELEALIDDLPIAVT